MAAAQAELAQARVYNNMALVYKYLGDYDQAEINLKKDLIITENLIKKKNGLKLFGDDEILQIKVEFAATLNNLGLVYFNQAKSYRFSTNMTDKEKREIENKRSSLLDLSLDYFKKDLKLTKEALKMKEQQEKINKAYKTESSNCLYHRDVAKTYNNMALVYASMGDKSNSEWYSRKAFEYKKP